MLKHPAISILEDLISICSVNPSLDEMSLGEAPVADYIEGRCRRAGVKVSRQKVLSGRDNVIVEVDAGKRDTLLFDAHMDTVPIGEMPDALTPIHRDGLLYGRGACDTKGSLAAMLAAMEEAALDPERLSCNLVMCCSVDEEYGMRGIRAFVQQRMSIAAAVVGEPTGLQIVIAHKGDLCFQIETRGKAAHSSVPHTGDSAISQMVKVLRFIEDQVQPGLARIHHELCGSSTLVVGKISGGTQANIVPEKCTVEIDRRLVPGEDVQQVMDRFTESLSEAMSGQGVTFSMKELFRESPMSTEPSAPIVTHARHVAQSMSLDSTLIGVPFGCHASTLQHRGGIPCIVFGPGSVAVAHSSTEHVPLVQVERAAQFYGVLTRTFRLDGNSNDQIPR